MTNPYPERLRQMRYKSGFSQKFVAQRIGVAQSAISCYESGEKEPTLSNLVALAHLYRCSADYLLGLDSRPGKPVSVQLGSLTEQQSAILYALLESWGCPPGTIEEGGKEA